MRCGHSAIFMDSDLFDAAGYKVRLVQLRSRITIIFYDGKWHLFEADLDGGPPINLMIKFPPSKN